MWVVFLYVLKFKGWKYEYRRAISALECLGYDNLDDMEQWYEKLASVAGYE